MIYDFLQLTIYLLASSTKSFKKSLCNLRRVEKKLNKNTKKYNLILEYRKKNPNEFRNKFKIILSKSHFFNFLE